MAGLELPHALEQRLAGEAELEREVVLQAVRVGRDPRQERQQRLHLRGEVQHVVDVRVVERLDAETVAREEQLAAALVPDSVGEHAAQPVEELDAPSPVGGEDDLGVAVGGEALPAELGAQLEIVVGLAVVGDDVAGPSLIG